MFDCHYLVTTKKEYVPYEKTVIEKKAPTDESIKIYNELREKAHNSILDSFYENPHMLFSPFIEDVAAERRKIRLKLSLTNLIEFKKEVYKYGTRKWQI